MSAVPAKELKIYYLFATEDEAYSKRLARHLSTIREQHHIIEYYHHDVPGGEHIEQQVAQHLSEAKIILLLISADLLVEEKRLVEQAMERYKNEHIAVIPILIRPTTLSSVPFAEQQILPRDRRAVAIWKNEDEAFVQIAEEIGQVIEKVVSEDSAYTLSPLSGEQLQPSIHHILETTEISKPQEEERIILSFQTIEEHKFPEEPEYMINWKKYFMQDQTMGQHQLKDPAKWNSTLLPDLLKTKEKISKATARTLLRVYGQSRLCCWFALGYTFRETTPYKLELLQRDGTWWRSDALASENFVLQAKDDPAGESIDGEGETIAVGIGVNQQPEKAIRQYLAERKEKIAALLLLESRGPLHSAQEAVALAEQVKTSAKACKERWNAKKLLLFYAGPVAGACFTGYMFNAVCPAVQVMEYNKPEERYIPTFLLK